MKNFLWLLIPFVVFAALPAKINAEFTTNDIKGITKSVERPAQENGYFLIETKEQLELAIDCGCDYVQGYYFSKPVSEKEFLDYMENENK